MKAGQKEKKLLKKRQGKKGKGGDALDRGKDGCGDSVVVNLVVAAMEQKSRQ
jgi:hypothetical protein